MNTSLEWVAEPPGWRLGLLQLKARPLNCERCGSRPASRWEAKSSGDVAMAQHQHMMMHMQAILWRQWLLKRRSLASTIVEVISPILLISLLVSTPVLQASSRACPGVGLPTAPAYDMSHAKVMQLGRDKTQNPLARQSWIAMCMCPVAGMSAASLHGSGKFLLEQC